jgi:hypothetical protein
MRNRTILAAALASFAASAAFFIPASAIAIDIHNCLPANVKILFYNERGRIELIRRERVDIAAGGSAMAIPLSGRRKYKVNIFDRAGNRFLASFGAIDAGQSYVLFPGAGGQVSMVTGVGCG